MGDLPPETRREHVVKFFEDYGSLGGIRLMNNFGFVDFKHKEQGQTLYVNFYRNLQNSIFKRKLRFQ